MKLYRRMLFTSTALGVVVAVVACNNRNATNVAGGSGSGEAANVSTPIDIGAPLYPSAAMPKPAIQGQLKAEPLVVQQATIQFDELITLGSQVDGVLELIATPLEPGKVYDPADPNFSGRLVTHPRDDSWWHVRLIEGDPIKEKQILALFDDSQAILQKDSLAASLSAAQMAHDQAKASEKDYQYAQEMIDRNSATSALEKIRYRVEYGNSRVTTARLFQELTRYSGEKALAEDKYARHKMISPINGRIVRVLRSRGSTVKIGEPILEIQSTARFRVEGTLDWQEAEKLQPSMPVMVEPIRSLSPEPFTERHLQEVTGIAITGHANPLMVSSSNAETIIIWDFLGTKKGEPHVCTHPSGVAVKSIAATSSKAKVQRIATGGSDGKVRVYDLPNPASLPDQPTLEFEESHGQAVTAIAFSPDGNYMATAAGRDVYLWDLETRKKKYSFPAEHRDDVKALQFTPQTNLVTVCRDKAARLWAIGQNGATVSKTLNYRSGAVDVLGVSSDGSRILFDQDATRLDLVQLGDNRSTGHLLNTGGNLRFANFALFSQDDKLIVTAAGDADTKGEMQLWSTPDSGRGSERRRLVTRDRAPVTCAAFAKDAQNTYVVAGTQTGVLHYWKVPNNSTNAAMPGRVISVTRRDSRTGQIRVEVENPGGTFNETLSDRGAATIIIDPTQKAVTPVIPMPNPGPMRPAQLPPMEPIPAGGGIRPVGYTVDPTNGAVKPVDANPGK